MTETKKKTVKKKTTRNENNKTQLSTLGYDVIGTKGRPYKLLNERGKQIITLMASLMCTDDEIASELGIDEDTMKNERNKDTFTECKEKGMLKGKRALRTMQFDSAKKGNVTMQIWLGKQYLGQREPENKINDNNIENLQTLADLLGVNK